VKRDINTESSLFVDVYDIALELEKLFAMYRSGEIWEISPLDMVESEYRKLRSITFSGDGEPTSSRYFPEAMEMALNCRDSIRAVYSDIDVVLITNVGLLHKEKVRGALRNFSGKGPVVWAKLDAGTSKYFQDVCGTKDTIQHILENILLIPESSELVIQTCFSCVDGKPPSRQELLAYIDKLRYLRKKGSHFSRVDVYTVSRSAADPGIRPLDIGFLQDVAGRINQLGMAARVYI